MRLEMFGQIGKAFKIKEIEKDESMHIEDSQKD